MSRPVVVTGFGVFPGVERNPTESLARSIDGAIVAGHPIVGVVLEVEYVRGPEKAIELARSVGAVAVLGLGVAASRARPSWELRAVGWPDGAADVAGHTATGLSGPLEVRSSLAPDRAAAFGAEASIDAGAYVCNAWLYRVSSALEVPVGFLHVPATGYPQHRLLTALASLLSELR